MSDKKISAPRGSTRKEMTDAEKEWLENFNRFEKLGDEKALAKIMPKNKCVNEVLKGIRDSRNAKHRDIYNHQIPVHVNPDPTTDWDEAIASLRDAPESLDIPEIEDETLNPIKDSDRFTSDDYTQPYPDEDALNAAIDIDRDREEKKKIKNFEDFKAKRKKYDDVG